MHKVISINNMVDFIVKHQTGWKIRRNSKEYKQRFDYILSKGIDEIIKIYKEL